MFCVLQFARTPKMPTHAVILDWLNTTEYNCFVTSLYQRKPTVPMARPPAKRSPKTLQVRQGKIDP